MSLAIQQFSQSGHGYKKSKDLDWSDIQSKYMDIYFFLVIHVRIQLEL